MNIFKKVKKTLEVVLHKEINPNTNLKHDLEVDSLDFVETIIILEEEFDIGISEVDSDGVETVQDLVDMLTRLLKNENTKYKL